MSRTVWITGASSGIGRSLALAMSRLGDLVVASARSAADLDKLVEEAAVQGHRIIPIALDVADEAAVRDVVAAISATVGGLDLAVLNAGTHQPVHVADFAPAVFRRLMEVNFMGTVNCLAALLPGFVARRGGQIAVVSSVAGYRGLPEAAAYGATKAALINMCEALKPELDAQGVRLTLINPGFVRTPLTDRNPFPMPFLMEPDAAAQRIVRGLATGGFEITFPRRFTWMLKLGRILPYALYFAIVRRITKR